MIGVGRLARHPEAKLQVKAAEYSRQNANELLLVQMRKLWNELEESYKQVKLSEESIATAEENVRLNTDYYKAGTVTLSDLLDAIAPPAKP